MHYRAEIDGLRAVAVLPVILFHAGLGVFGGGFVGVDVFFVISGYLITGVILDEQRAGRFSLLRFYERRARRILPALYVVMLACIPLAWASMLPDDLENFGQSLVATTFFANNLLLWKTAGYWDLASEFKPLLHTWSLGVEEQYYLLFPLLVVALRRRRAALLGPVVAALLVLSLVAAQQSSASSPSFAFYSLTTRAWELLAGACTALALRERRAVKAAEHGALAQALSWAGIALVGGSMLFFRSSTPNPSLWTALPVLGTVLLIAFASPANVVGRALASRPLVGIGLVSYSAYLLHQPVFAFLRLRSLEEPGAALMVGGAIAALALSVLSWRFVERPFRDPAFIGPRAVFAAAVLVGAPIAGAGLLLHARSGFVDRWPELASGTAPAAQGQNIAFNEAAFRFRETRFTDDPRTRKILVVGNSFARDFINAALENGYFSASELAYDDRAPACIAQGGLPPEQAERIARADVLVFGSPIERLECWQSDLAELARLSRARVIVIGTKNFGWNMNAVAHLPVAERYGYRAKVLRGVLEENARQAAAIDPSQFVDLIATLADAEQRMPVFTPERKIVSQDRVHLTKDGARYIGGLLFEHPLLRDLK